MRRARSDKATVEITSPYTGLVKRLCGDVGTIAQVGGVLCEIEVEAEAGLGAVAEPVSVCILETPQTSTAKRWRHAG